MNAELQLKRTDSKDSDLRQLVQELDKDLKVKDGEDHDFFNQFNHLDFIQYCVVGYFAEKPVACGAIKFYNDQTMEIKRMFVDPGYRGKGFASQILKALENWAAEFDCQYCILETGLKQQDAVKVFVKNGFFSIPNYGQYEGVENSLCFKNEILPTN